MLPYRPRDDDLKRSNTSVERGGHGFVGVPPAVEEGLIPVQHDAGKPQISIDIVPNRTGEGAADEDVLHGLGSLVAKHIDMVVG